MSNAPRRTAALTCASLLLALAGCTDDSGTAPPEEGEDLGARLAAARTQIDDAPSVDFTIATDELPSDVNGLLQAAGTGTSDPAFDGTARVSAGTAIDAEVISVDDSVYAKVGFAPTFIELDPATLGAPDPAAFFDPDGGVSSLLVATDDLAAGEDERQGEEVFTTITGTLPGELITGLLPTADEAGTFDVSYRLSEDDRLRGASITGPFYSGSADVTYDLTIDPSDETVEITAP